MVKYSTSCLDNPPPWVQYVRKENTVLGPLDKVKDTLNLVTDQTPTEKQTKLFDKALTNLKEWEENCHEFFWRISLEDWNDRSIITFFDTAALMHKLSNDAREIQPSLRNAQKMAATMPDPHRETYFQAFYGANAMVTGIINDIYFEHEPTFEKRRKDKTLPNNLKIVDGRPVLQPVT